MKRSEKTIKNQRIRYVCADFMTTALAFFAFNIVRFFLLREWDNGFTDVWGFLGSDKIILEQCIVPPCLLTIYWLSGYYNKPFNKSRLQELNTTICSAAINTVIIYLILLINDQTGKRIINYELIIVLWGLLFSFTYIARFCITSYAIRNFRKKIWTSNILIIGNSEVSRQVAKILKKTPRDSNYNIIGFVEIPGEESVDDDAMIISLDRLKQTYIERNIDQIVLAPQYRNDKKVMELLAALFPFDLPVKISPDTFSFVTSAIRLQDIYGEPFVDLTGPAIGEASKNIKRTFDVAVSSLILILFSPIFAFLAIIIKTSSKGPIFYSQQRIGLHQKPFKIYKFRSMVEDSESTGPQLSDKQDPRVTKPGRWMRKYRIDELPQFWNVLKGEMSLVGPRPEREFYIRQIVKKAPYYTLVCQVRPGITSWGMVKYGYASNVDQMVERTRYDLIYIANMSLSVDVKILIYTIKTVLGGKGV